MFKWVGDQRIYSRSLELLFSQSISALVSASIAAFVLIYSFWDIAATWVPVVWVLGYVALAMLRLFLQRAFNRSQPEVKNSPKWFPLLAVMIFFTGMLWGLYLLYLVSIADGSKLVILIANYSFLLAVAVTAYGVSFPIFLLFSSPIMLPVVGYLLATMETGNWQIAGISLGWYLLLVSASRRFGEFATRALGYEYQNVDLVARLEEQNLRAETLAQELIVLSNTDALTDIYNRRYFDENLVREVARAERSGQALSLILCDVDFFKAYNDTLGHIEGDKCLQQVAQSLSGAVRGSSDFVARFGGEEFAVVLANTDLEQARLFSERLRSSIRESEIIHPQSPLGSFLTISFGLTNFDISGDDSVEKMIERADKALYAAKEAGRDQVQWLAS